MSYVVSMTVKSLLNFDEPVTNIQYYSGKSLVEAMSAMAMAAAEVENDEKWYTVQSVTLTVKES